MSIDKISDEEAEALDRRAFATRDDRVAPTTEHEFSDVLVTLERRIKYASVRAYKEHPDACAENLRDLRADSDAIREAREKIYAGLSTG